MTRPSALFGEIALYDPSERSASEIVLEEICVLRVRTLDELAQISKKPELAVDMIHLSGQRMRWMGRQLRKQMFLPVPPRLAHKVRYLIPARLRTPTKLRLSHAEFAEFVGPDAPSCVKDACRMKIDWGDRAAL